MAVRGAAGCGREELGSRVRGLCARWRRGSAECGWGPGRSRGAGAGGELCECVRVGGGEPTSPGGLGAWWGHGVGARASRDGEGRGGEGWRAGLSAEPAAVPPRGRRRPGLCAGRATRQEAAPEDWELRRGQARGARAFRGDVTVGAPATRVPCSRTDGCAPAVSLAPRLRAWEAGDPGGGRGDRAQGSVAERGGGCVCVLQDAGLTFGALVAGGGRRGAEGKRNTRQARGRGGPSFLGRPFSQRAVSFLGFWVGLKSTPGAGVRPEPCPGSGSPRRARSWGSGPEWRRLSRVTMRYWGAGGGEAARLNGDPGPGLARVSAGSDPGPMRDPHGSLHPECPPPPHLSSNAAAC